MIKKSAQSHIFKLVFSSGLHKYARFNVKKQRRGKMDKCNVKSVEDGITPQKERRDEKEKCRAERKENAQSRLDGKNGEVIRKRAKRLMYMTVIFFASWLIAGAEFGFEAYPFGIALICAANTFYIPISAGFILGYILSDMGRGYLFSYIAIFAVKFVLSYLPVTIADRELDTVKNENNASSSDLLEGGENASSKRGVVNVLMSAFKITYVSERNRNNREKMILSVCFAAIGGFVAGLFGLIENDFSFYSLYGLLFLVAACPVLAYLLFGIANKGEGVSDIKLCVAILTLMVICVFSSGDKTVFGMMLKPMLAVCFTLVASHRRGVLSGCLTGLLCGGVFSLLYLPLLLLCAPVYCFIKEFKMSAAIAAVCGAVLLYCYYFGKTDGLVSMLTPMLLGVPLFLVSVRFLEFADPKVSRSVANENMYFTEAIIEKNKNCAVSNRIYALSDAFSSLSKTFYELSDSFHRPEFLHLRDITDESFICVCDGCRHYDVCHGSEYSGMLDANSKITAALHSKGIVEKSDLPDKFISVCIRADRVVNTANDLCAKHTEKMIKGQNISAFASNYNDVHSVLLDAINSDDKEYICDTQSGDRIFDYLISLGFDVKGVVVCGTRQKKVIVRGVGLNEMTDGQRARDIASGVSEIVCDKMSGPVFEVNNDGTDMIFNSKPKYSIICSHARRAAFEMIAPKRDSDEEQTELIYPFDDTASERRDEDCGDVTGAFITGNSYFYSVICDGMGSGKDAAYIAGISRVFAEKMLCAGNKADITLRMMNSFLRSENYEKGQECSVAIDLFEFDLMSGTAAFIKSGGMPTYILRRDKVYKVSSKTMPLGIIKTPDVKITKLDMQSGDIVVMLSDGCTHDEDDCKWLINLLLENKIDDKTNLFESGEEMADSLRDSILKTSREMLPKDKNPDDISASVSIIV